MKEQPRVIYYKDELNDEFSRAKIEAKKIDENYRYLREDFFHRALAFVAYRVIATPLAGIFLKILCGHKIVNKKVLKQAKGNYFLYANHTNAGADPFIPTMVAFPKRVYVIVHPANVSMPFLGRINPYLGALPLPDTLKASENFLAALNRRVGQNHVVCIYPEAHIWPYYTGIRPFRDASFRYPVQYGSPVFAFTNTYQKSRFRKKPRIVTYVDGPFLPDPTLPPKEARKKLRDEVYAAMTERSKSSDVDYIVYLPESERNSAADGAETDARTETAPRTDGRTDGSARTEKTTDGNGKE
ncbi:MAG: lysophospholipid acyltransferase family protein [Candidatus Borkfalkiaceae bacterium]|nr:lysophospholipid acyltransferase family protein [Christensenellaceae bacterium]